MNDIISERADSVLRVQLNRPASKNAMTSAMYVALAEVLNAAAKDDEVRVVLWHGAGDSFCAGNDIGDFMKYSPGAGESPQALLMKALINFDKPIVVAVQGVAIGGGTTMLTHCDFVFAAENAKFQMPFVNLGLVPEFGSSFSIPARMGYLHAAELILTGQFFDARRAAELGLVTRVVPNQELLATATDTAQKLALKAPSAIQACKHLLKQSTREQVERAIELESEEFAAHLRSPETREAFAAFLEKRAPNFNKVKEPAVMA